MKVPSGSALGANLLFLAFVGCVVITIASETLLDLEEACSFEIGGRNYKKEEINARFKEFVGFSGA